MWASIPRESLKQTLAGTSFAVFALACGGESDSDSSDAAASGSTTTSAVTASTGDGSGGNTAGSQATASVAGDAASSTVSTTGGPQADCSGSFGEPVELFAVDTTAPQSFAITPDELELYYVIAPQDVRIIERRVRSSRSSSFGPAEAVPELLDLCPGLSPDFAVGTIDLSPDGLVAYIACETVVELPTTLVRATRTALGAAFTPDPTPLGIVGASFATADGLEGFANTPEALDQIDRYQRTSLTVPFGEAERLPIVLRGPDPSNDGRWLFGGVPIAGTDQYQLAAAMRPDRGSPFGEPTSEGFPSPPAGFSDYTPTISADCRSLYFLRLGASTMFSVMVSER